MRHIDVWLLESFLYFGLYTIFQWRNESTTIQRQPATPVQTSAHYSLRPPHGNNRLLTGRKKTLSICRVFAPLWLIQLRPLETLWCRFRGAVAGLILKAKAPTVYLSSQGLVGPFSSPTLSQQGKNAIRKHLFVTLWIKGIYYFLIDGPFVFWLVWLCSVCPGVAPSVLIFRVYRHLDIQATHFHFTLQKYLGLRFGPGVKSILAVM